MMRVAAVVVFGENGREREWQKVGETFLSYSSCSNRVYMRMHVLYCSNYCYDIISRAVLPTTAAPEKFNARNNVEYRHSTGVERKLKRSLMEEMRKLLRFLLPDHAISDCTVQ